MKNNCTYESDNFDGSIRLVDISIKQIHPPLERDVEIRKIEYYLRAISLLLDLYKWNKISTGSHVE